MSDRSPSRAGRAAAKIKTVSIRVAVVYAGFMAGVFGHAFVWAFAKPEPDQTYAINMIQGFGPDMLTIGVTGAIVAGAFLGGYRYIEPANGQGRDR